MRILVIGRFYTEQPALHISETLDEMGHLVFRYEPTLRAYQSKGIWGHRFDQIRGFIYNATDNLPFVRQRRIQKLWHLLKQQTIELVLVCHDFLWPEEVAELKHRTGAPVAMWFSDAMIHFNKGFFLTAPYDALFFKDTYIVKILANIVESSVYYLPECFNPHKHYLPEKELKDEPAYQCDITTVGNLHSWRVAWYKHLVGYDVKLWGPPPPLWINLGGTAKMYQKKGVYELEKAKAFRGAKIVINNLHYGEIHGLNVRAFEVAGAGAFQLLNWRADIAQLFKDGEELVTFKTVGDLYEKIDYYLMHEDKRKHIARQGQQRAFAEHTYRHRLRLLLDTVANQAHGYPVPNISYPSDP